LGAQAYLYGYSLVIVDVTRASTVRTPGGENVVLRLPRFPDASSKWVVRPKVNALYISAFINMDQGPLVFELAENDQRYEVMPSMDAWSNVFASLGALTTRTNGGKYLLAGPAWQGEVPTGPRLLAFAEKLGNPAAKAAAPCPTRPATSRDPTHVLGLMDPSLCSCCSPGRVERHSLCAVNLP